MVIAVVLGQKYPILQLMNEQTELQPNKTQENVLLRPQLYCQGGQ